MLVKFETIHHVPVYVNTQAIQVVEIGMSLNETTLVLYDKKIEVKGGFDEVADKINTVVSW